MTDIDELLKETPTLTFDAGLGTKAEEPAPQAAAEEAPKMEEVELTELLANSKHSGTYFFSLINHRVRRIFKR